MGDYNMTYLILKKKLSILKLLSESSTSKSKIDGLLKELDERYSENKPLSIIESQLEKVENEIKK